MGKLFLFISLLLLQLSPVVANDTIVNSQKELIYDLDSSQKPQEFNQNTLENFKENPHFDYTEAHYEENLWQKFKNWLYRLWVSFWEWLFGDYTSNRFLVFLFENLPYIIIALILIFLLWLFYKLNPGARFLHQNPTAEVTMLSHDDLIHHQNIPWLIEQAILDKNYRLAVRYCFILLLKQLSDSKLINYENDKTNFDYSMEIPSAAVSELFKKIAVIYEYIWYGSFEVSADEFQKVHTLFHQIKQQIPNYRDAI